MHPEGSQRRGLVFGAAVAVVVTVLATGALASADEDAPPDSDHDPRGPFIFAVEDTLQIPAFFQMSTIEIRADRLGIREIVDRCIAREEELRERIESHEYQQFVKTVLNVGGSGDDADRQLVIEQADLVRFADGDSEVIPVRLEKYRLANGAREEWATEDDPAIKISYRDLNGLPFYLEDRGNYGFEIRSRELVGDRVIYEVDLEPRSDFEIAPSGTIWIDTTNFQILREEFDFGHRVPIPLFVRSIGPVVRERERVGDLWVWKRILARVEMRGGVFKWLERDFPDTVEFTIVFRNHVVNGESFAAEQEGR